MSTIFQNSNKILTVYNISSTYGLLILTKTLKLKLIKSRREKRKEGSVIIIIT